MKKMRRMIPAFAMLMVAAIMLSTASFAWFTMSTEVSAAGMEIKAKAGSSLVISEAPLTYNTGRPDVDFETSVTSLYPMTYQEKYTTDSLGDDVSGWVVPTNTAGINTATGAMVAGDAWKDAEAAAGTHFVEKEVYIASAGAAMTGKKITISLSAPVSSIGSAVKAYAAAIYYVPAIVDDEDNKAWEDNATIPVNQKPDKVVYVDTADGRDTVTLDGPFDIPSIIGVGEQDDTTTGLKFIIRFFVDGDLTSYGDDKVTITTGYEYERATGKYNSTVQYYVAAADTYKYDVVSAPKANDFSTYYVLVDGVYTAVADNENAIFDDTGATAYYTQQTIKNYNQAIIPEGMTAESNVLASWFVRNAITESVNYKYIRTDDVPGTGSELEISFTTK